MSKENKDKTQTSEEQLNFDKDKSFLLEQTTEYLLKNSVAPEITTEMQKSLIVTRKNINDQIKQSNLSEALTNLEKLRDLRSGITHSKIPDENDVAKSNYKGTPILIRDARKCKEPPVRSIEAFEMQYLNAVRAAIDIVDLEQKDPNYKNDINPHLQDTLKQKAIIFDEKIRNYNPEPSQKELSKLVKAEIKDIAKTMEKNGVKDTYKKLNVSKDFQSFNENQANIVTISNIKGHTIIEAEVGYRELTLKQKEEYQNIDQGKNQPKWFDNLSKYEKQLTQEYAKKIAEGKHVIPTQLRQIAGMRNAFEKTTAILEVDGENKGDLTTLHTSKHAGTLASLNKNKEASENITTENAMQAKRWMIGKVLHCNTLNAGVIGSGDDPKIVSRTEKAMEKVGGRITNTSFNTFRLFGIANNYDGVKHSLEAIAKTNPELKAHIKPRSRLNRLFGLNKPKNNADDILNKIKDPELKNIYKNAIELRKTVERANVPFKIFFDKENINSVVSKELNLLTKKIINNPTLLPSLPREEMLTMCASGKDRTGLAEHDQSAQVITDEINKRAKDQDSRATIQDIDKALLANGHTAQQAGGINAGGGTIGCFGTKSENKAGIPKSRIENLQGIIEKSASTNKIKGTNKSISSKEKENIRIANESKNEPAKSLQGKKDLDIVSKQVKSEALVIKNDALLNNRKKTIDRGPT